MKNKLTNKILIFISISFCFLLGIIVSSDVMALESVTEKAMKYGLNNCYIDSRFKSKVDISEQYFDAKTEIVKAEGDILLPNYNSTGLEEVNCQELLFGKDGWNGILGLSGNLKALDESERRNTVERLQYTKMNSSGKRKCFSMTATWQMIDSDKKGEMTSNKVCADVDSSGKMTTRPQTVGQEFTECPSGGQCIFIHTEGNWIRPTIVVGDKRLSAYLNFEMNQDKWDDAISAYRDSLKNGDRSQWEEYYDDDEDHGEDSDTINFCVATGKDLSKPFDYQGNCFWYVRFDKNDSGIKTSNDPSNTSGASYELKDYNNFTTRTSLGKKAQESIFGDDNVTLTYAEVVSLYQKYLNSYDGVDIACNFENESDAKGVGFSEPVKIASDGEINQCYARINSKKDFNGIHNNRIFGKKVSITDIIDWLNMNINKANLDDVDSLANSDFDYDTSGDGKGENTCTNSGAAGSLGWIVCPILEWMGNAAQSIYNDTIKPILEIRPSYFENTNTRNAWGTFRDIANIAFVILILVVIFSQLTGIGIDNYGVKKILPKLIIAAILINLSYLICVICVDLSNIFGNSLQGFFNGLGQNMVQSGAQYKYETMSGSYELGNALDVGFVAVGIIFAVFLIWSVVDNPALLLTLLVAVIGVLISIIFLFVLLVGREALIVLLTVISPVAFVLYMLPNTKKLFDKWLKLWEAMLLLYPICGLLIGGGNFASSLILYVGLNNNSGFINTVTALTAMVIGIIPLFFVPKLLKGAFAAMGTIGSTISGFGSRLRSGATGRLKNSERYKNAQERGQARQQRRIAQRRAGVYVDKDGNVKQRRRPSARFRRRLANTGFGRAIGMDAAIGKNTADYLQQEAARRKNIDSANLGIAQAEFQEGENARVERQQKGVVGVAPVNADVVRRKLENERMKTEVEVELGPVPLLNRDNLRTRTQNTINEAMADNNVDVLPVNVALATQRRQAARDAQELKAYQDQYSNFDKTALATEARNLARWRGERGWQQKLSALIGAMESRGMERNIYSMLGANDISGEAAVMSTLANSQNKVLKAYGKTGTGDYNSFMNGTGAGTMQGYIQGKGKEFLNGIDDKALAEIASHNNGSAMSNDLLVEAAARVNDADSLNQVNDMLSHRVGRGDRFAISGEQLAKFDDSTIFRMLADANSRQALLNASDSISPELAGVMNANGKIRINSLRSGRTDGGNINPI